MDLDDPACASIIATIENAGIHIDVLVNNAGFSIHNCVESFAEEELRRQMEAMYFAPARLIRAVVPWMRERRAGVVVNMSSGAGLEGRESMGGYAPAKAALDGGFVFVFVFVFALFSFFFLFYVMNDEVFLGEIC